MLFHASIRKELARSFGATLLVLLMIVTTMMLIRTLGQAAKGQIGAADVVRIMGLTTLGHLGTMVALGVFIAIVAVLARMYRDSEMVIWFAAGRGLGACLVPVLRFAAAPLAAIVVLSLWIWPWSHAQILQLRTQFEQRSDVDRVAPGQFQASADGSRVIFVDEGTLAAGGAGMADTSPALRNIFVVESRAGVETVTSAQAAHVELGADDIRRAVLHHGQRMQDDAASGEVTMTHFQRYELALLESDAARAALTTRATSTADLLKADSAPHDRAELAWRLSQPLMALNLVILALAITHVNPRIGHSTSTAVAILVFIAYYNFNSVGQSWVGTGRWSMAALMGLHASVFAVAALIVAARHGRWLWRLSARQR